MPKQCNLNIDIESCLPLEMLGKQRISCVAYPREAEKKINVLLLDRIDRGRQFRRSVHTVQIGFIKNIDVFRSKFHCFYRILFFISNNDFIIFSLILEGQIYDVDKKKNEEDNFLFKDWTSVEKRL